MRYIDLENNPPPKEWIDRATEKQKLVNAETDKSKQNDLINQYSNVWRDKVLKEHLLGLSNGKCWYSEAKETFSHYHTEHFRPKKKAIGIDGNDKGGYYWLAFDWKNYRISGSVGNSKKGSRFAVKKNKADNPSDDLEDELIYFLDPTDKDDVIELTFDEEGIVSPLSINSSDWNYQRASYTIKWLDLNFKPLKDARKNLWINCVDKIREIQNIVDEYNKNPSGNRKAKFKEKTATLRKLAHSSSPFSATVRDCLIKSGKKWAERLLV